MARQNPPSGRRVPVADGDRSKGDPWHAFGYLVSGVLMYGLIGWGLDHWLGTTFLVAIGILVGAGFGLYMTFARFNSSPHDEVRRRR
ncbi:MAG: AtpZ/AtpI family protein [Nocardioides sp.]